MYPLDPSKSTFQNLLLQSPYAKGSIGYPDFEKLSCRSFSKPCLKHAPKQDSKQVRRGSEDFDLGLPKLGVPL